MNHYDESLILMNITIVKSCRCYCDYWKAIKMFTSPYVEFDYSIEKTLSYRKYFYHQNLLYHFCINCFSDFVSSIPTKIIEDEILRGHMGCIFKIRHKSMVLSECCRICVNYTIKHYFTLFNLQTI